MAITTGAHPKALWPGVEAWFGAKYNEHPLECVDLFDVSNSKQAYEENVEATSFALAPVKAEGAGIAYDSHSQGVVARYTAIAYALGYIVTKEEIDDNLYKSKAFDRAESLAFSMRQTKENVGANVYNRAFDNTYLGADGLELISTAHTMANGGTFANEPNSAVDFSQAALEDMLILIAGATNSRGLKISLIGECIVIPRQLQFEVERVLTSQLQSNTAENAKNVVQNILPKGVKLNHYLTDADAWFIRTNAPRGMRNFNRQSVEFERDTDFDTKNARASAYERYSFGWTDPRGIYGSPGA
jgi:hypothetical protein